MMKSTNPFQTNTTTFSVNSSNYHIGVPKGVTEVVVSDDIKQSLYRDIFRDIYRNFEDTKESKDHSGNGNPILYNVKLPDTLTEIHEKAFYDCNMIKTITIPPNVKRIGVRAFSYCDNLEVVNLPDGLEVIEKEAFFYCKKLKDITIPLTVKQGDLQKAFGGCDNYLQATVGKMISERKDPRSSDYDSNGNVTYSPDDTSKFPSELEYFTCLSSECDSSDNGELGCKSISTKLSMKAITCAGCSFSTTSNILTLNAENCNQYYFKFGIPEGVTDIVFSDDIEQSLYKILLCDKDERGNPLDTQEYYEDHAYNVILPETLIEIEDRAFYDCNLIKSIKIPPNVKRIRPRAFFACDNLKVVNLPEGLEVIDKEAFKYCEKLRDIEIPITVTTIETDAFQYCSIYLQNPGKDKISEGNRYDLFPVEMSLRQHSSDTTNRADNNAPTLSQTKYTRELDKRTTIPTTIALSPSSLELDSSDDGEVIERTKKSTKVQTSPRVTMDDKKTVKETSTKCQNIVSPSYSICTSALSNHKVLGKKRRRSCISTDTSESISFDNEELTKKKVIKITSKSNPIARSHYREFIRPTSNPKQRCISPKSSLDPVRQYYHSRTYLPISMAEWDKEIDSDEDDDDDWIREVGVRLMDEFDDVSKAEKEFMTLWNNFMKSYTVIADRVIPYKCREFVLMHHEQILNLDLRMQLVLHLFNLWDHGLLRSKVIVNLMILFDEMTSVLVND